ncbi:putative selenate ABC transporter substrate-binding protein [Ideonella sp. DXS29W]|uniref:Selenate ABC transporter substrate-binding protein n=1 Tax=Ideonella lacteola TaxID=2984193 RepID=A0ABU9BLI4_9BURK
MNDSASAPQIDHPLGTEPHVHLSRRRLLLAGAAALMGASARAQTGAPAVLRVTAIPDEAPTELARKFAPLGRYLESQLGLKVEWTPVTDYAAAVEALVNRKVDLAWFGGFTFVQASERSGGKVVPLVQREEDAKFRSVFITAADSGIKTLLDLKGRTFSFGSASSTSGHLMPRHFLLAAGIQPEADFKRLAFSGAHDATIAAVASGKVDAGALNISVWDKFVADKKVDPQQVKVFFTTPAYYDYNWSVHADMAAPLRDKLRQAFLSLDGSNPAQQEILSLQRATRFIPTAAENYQGIRAAAASAGLLK